MFVFSKGPIKTFHLIRDRRNKTHGRIMSGTVRQEDGTTKPSRANGKIVAEFGSRTNVWEYSTGNGKSAADQAAYQHPAIFPESLVEDHIRSWSNPGDVVLDPFMGSGTTGKMAAMLGRIFIGVEISDEYFALAQARINAATMPPQSEQQRLFI
jgi:site-specific DNA-methyltransferase (adenine-specific)